MKSFILICLFSLTVYAQDTNSGAVNANISKIGGTSLSGMTLVDSSNDALRVNCVFGCSGGGGGGGLVQIQVRKADDSGWLNVGYAAGNLNMPVQGTVTANAGSGIFNVFPASPVASSYVPVRITNGSTFEPVLAVSQSGTWNIGALTSITNSVAVTGTFWQATQPVSLASVPAHNVTNAGTFAVQAAQSGAWSMSLGAAIPAGTNNIGDVDVATLPSVIIGTFPDNEPFNVAQVGGSAVSTAATGVQKVGVTGNAGAAVDAANNAAAPANVIVDGFEVATQTATQPAAATAGNVRRGLVRQDGVLYTAPHGPVIWNCGLSAIGTTLTQCQAAPGAGLRLYITDVVSQSNTATAGLFTLRFGTGTNCGTGTGNLIFSSASALMASPANTQPVNHFHLTTPIAVTANNAVCVLGVATNVTNIQISGYTAP